MPGNWPVSEAKSTGRLEGSSEGVAQSCGYPRVGQPLLGRCGEHWFRGEYREIVPNERVVQTFEYEPFPGASVETMTLEDLGEGRTLVRVRAVYPSKEAADAMIQSGMEEGANETYDRLAELLEQRKRAA